MPARVCRGLLRPRITVFGTRSRPTPGESPGWGGTDLLRALDWETLS